MSSASDDRGPDRKKTKMAADNQNLEDRKPSRKESKATGSSSKDDKPAVAKRGRAANAQIEPWIKEEEQIYWRDIERQYKPDWSWIHEQFKGLDGAHNKNRTDMARQQHYTKKIRPELLQKAGLDAKGKAQQRGS